MLSRRMVLFGRRIPKVICTVPTAARANEKAALNCSTPNYMSSARTMHTQSTVEARLRNTVK